ncbi:hypothetical protein CBR_g38730 [Chara braunii]|uniref:Uncharacterized protein n=1 Tax=Chara braunii TaxID=69332 RepID=A0A388LQC0_CHABU|nr:hypothetical protein CBR_g38730 [Chara braunii]|eukprot:GBG84445.1 hypothetical protein CBR_g38730 [Chara braunii]
MAEAAAPTADGVPNSIAETGADAVTTAEKSAALASKAEEPSAEAPKNDAAEPAAGEACQATENKEIAPVSTEAAAGEGKTEGTSTSAENADVNADALGGGDKAVAVQDNGDAAAKDGQKEAKEGDGVQDPLPAAEAPSAVQPMESEGDKESGGDEVEVVKEVVTEVVAEVVADEVKAVVHEEVKEEDVNSKEVGAEGGVQNEEMEEAPEEKDEGEPAAKKEEEGKRGGEAVEDSGSVEPEKKKQKTEGEVSNEVKLGPKVFRSSTEMYGYFFDFLHGWSVNHDVNKYEFMVLSDLLMKGHAEPARKVGCGIESFQVRFHPKFDTRCYYILRKDNSFEDFSYRKCVDKLMGLPKELLAEVLGPKGRGGGRGGGGGRWRGGRGGGGRGGGYRGGRRGGRNW